MATNERTSRDALLRAIIALPNAANTVNSAALDLGANPVFALENVQVKLSSEAATGANNKNISVALQHSNESNANFANIAEFVAPLLKVTDNNNGGYPAGEALVYLPPGVKRYIRATATGEANGGNASNGDLTVELLF